MSGRHLGDFVLGEKLGEGAFGVVFLAEQPILERQAVIKMLHARHHDEGGARDMFLHEARLASRLEHPGAAHIYAFGSEEDGLLWIAMELVRGTPLARWLETRGPLPPPRLVALFEQLCDVVQAAHDQGIVHRDLKPANVMVTERGGRLEAKLLDFGLARLATEATGGEPVGTPLYMAPELWDNVGPGDAASDQYALGVIAYECATGSPPFTGSYLKVGNGHLTQPLPPIASPLAAAIERACAKRPADRHPSVAAFAAALRAALGLDVEAPPPLPDALRRAAAELPQPLAEAVAALEAARNLHQAADAARAAVHTFARFVGAVALAARTRGPAGALPDLVRELPRRALAAEEWLALARALAVAAPFPELPEALAAPLALDVDPDASGSGRTRERHAALVAALVELCARFAFLAHRPLVVARDGGAELWMGPRRVARALAAARGLPDGRPVLLDAEHRPALLLWPLVQVAPPTPGAAPEMFLFAGPGRRGARLVAPPLDFERHDPGVWEWLRGVLEVAPEESEAQGGVPYRGLLAYTAGDAGSFFGREAQTEAFLNRLRTQALLVVAGPSGSGKSSFVQAGVIPALGPGWRAVVVRPGPDPVAALRLRLRRDLGTEDPGEAGGNVLVVVDQFEEAFTLGGDARGFAEALVAAARDPVRVVVTIRDDFLARAAALPALRDRLAPAVQLLTTPAPADLLRILVEPARRAGYSFDDPELPARMVTEVAGAPGALALLSFTAARLWEQRDRHFRRLTRAAYEAMGGVGGALAGHAEAVLAELPPSQQRRVREAFRHLVTADGTRAVLPRADLDAIAGDAVVERLVAARLLTATDEGQVEIAHEALLAAWPRLVEWRREDAESARLRDQLRAAARTWDERRRPRGLLWRGDALAEYRRWRARAGGPLPAGEEAFAAASLRDDTRGRRTRALLVGGAIAVLAVASVFLYALQRRAQAAAAEARARLTESYAEQGRQLMLAGDTLRGLAYLDEAFTRGDRSAGVRYLLARGLGELSAQLAVYPQPGPVLYLDVSPDGTLMVTTSGETSGDRSARLWRAGELVATLQHDARVDLAAFSGDGRRIVTAGRDHRLRLWNARGAPVAEVAFDPERALAIGSTRDGRVAVVAGDGRLALWDPEGTQGLVWSGAAGHATAAALGGDLVAVAEGARVRVQRIDGESVATLEHARAVKVLAVSRDGALVASAGDGDPPRVWDAATGRPRLLLPGDGATVPRMRFCDADQVIAIASTDGVVRLWDTLNGRLRANLIGHRGSVYGLSCMADLRVWTGSYDRTVRLWDARRAQIATRLWVGGDGVQSLDASPDGKLVVAGNDESVAIWDARSRRLIRRIDQQGGRVATARVSRDGSKILVAGMGDHEARVYDAASGALLHRLRGHTGDVIDAGFSPDGSRIVTASYDGTARVWEDEVTRLTLTGHTGWIRTACFSPDGRWIVTASLDRTARVWTADRGEGVVTLQGNSFMQSAGFDKTSTRIVTAGSDKTVRVWALDGRLLATLDGHTRDVRDAEISPAGDLVASAGNDGSIAIHDLRSEKLLVIHKVHVGRAEDVLFLSDGTLVTAGSEDDEVLWWDVSLFRGSAREAHGAVACRVPFSLADGTLSERPIDPRDCSSH